MSPARAAGNLLTMTVAEPFETIPGPAGTQGTSVQILVMSVTRATAPITMPALDLRREPSTPRCPGPRMPAGLSQFLQRFRASGLQGFRASGLQGLK